MEKHPVLERLSRGQSLVLDGGITTELVRRGFNINGPLKDAAAMREAPEMLVAIHRAYLEAGSDVIAAHTSRTSARALSRAGLGMRAAALTHRAVDLALESIQNAGRPVAVAAVLGTLEERVDRVPSPRSLCDEHTEQTERFLNSGCHLIIVDVMPTLIETIAGTAAARRMMPSVWTTIGVRNRNAMPDGTSVDDAAVLAVAAGAQAIILEGANITELNAALTSVAARTLAVPLGVRWTGDVDSPTRTATPERFSQELATNAARNARLVGGSTGSTPDQIRALALKVRSRAVA